MKKHIIIALCCTMILAQSSFVYAAEDNGVSSEVYEMVENTEDSMPRGNEIEVMPYTLYIANIYTSIVKVSSSQVSIRAETVCGEKVKSITVTYILQKWSGSKWVNVASSTATAHDATNARKSYTISGLSSGQYRCKASAMAPGYSGYSETLTGYSASITI